MFNEVPGEEVMKMVNDLTHIFDYLKEVFPNLGERSIRTLPMIDLDTKIGALYSIPSGGVLLIAVTMPLRAWVDRWDTPLRLKALEIIIIDGLENYVFKESIDPNNQADIIGALSLAREAYDEKYKPKPLDPFSPSGLF